MLHDCEINMFEEIYPIEHIRKSKFIQMFFTFYLNNNYLPFEQFII